MNTVTLPLMTSNNDPEYFSATATTAGSVAWQAFDGNAGTSWGNLPGVSDHSVTLSLGRTCHVFKWRCSVHNGAVSRIMYIYVYGSVDGQTWSLIYNTSRSWKDTWWTFESNVNTNQGFSYLKVRIQTGGNATAQKSLLGEATFFVAESDFATDIFDTDTYPAYYVSQQNGSDNNDGRTPATAWSTITKAFDNAKSNLSGDTYVYIGPGTYSKGQTDVFAPWYSGLDSAHRIIYKGDPECAFLTDDKPGGVILSDEYDTVVYPDSFICLLNKQFIEFDNINFVSTKHSYTILGSQNTCGQISKNCHIWSSSSGCREITSVNNEVSARNNGFELCNSYNCIALGGNISASYAGFSGGISYNCLAALCTLGYLNNVAYNSEAWLCGSVASGGSATNCLASQCYVTSLPAGWTGTMCGQSVASIINTSPLVVQKLNLLNTLRAGLADWGYDLSAVPEAMVDADGVPRHSTLSDIGPWELADHNLEYNNFYLNSPAIKLNGHNQLIFDLPVKKDQEITKSVYVKWFEPDTVDVKLNINMTNYNTSDHIVESSNDSVGYEAWRAFDSDGTTTYWASSGNLPQWVSYELSREHVANKYIIGIPANSQDLSPKSFTFEGWNGAQWIVLDTQSDIVWSSGEIKTFTFENTTAYKKYRLNVSEVQTSILNIYSFEIWGTFGKSDIDVSLKPQLVISDFGETRTVSCAAVGGQWEKLSITFTPIQSGVISVKLVARNPASGSYAIFSDPQ